MSLKLQDVLPVVLSVMVIILVAVLEKQSKLFAAIAATMPLTIPLALWIVYSSTAGEQAAVSKFTLGLVLSLIPTLLFALTTWLTARAGLKLIPIITSGYAVWALATGIMLLMRRWLGAG